MAKKKQKNDKKIFVLDTSVLLYDHKAIKNFAEHDVVIPITVLEEVDRFKKGNDVINFEAREFIRVLDQLSQKNSLQDWLPINGQGKGKFKVQMNEKSKKDANVIFGEKKADHNILNVASQLADERPDSSVILVTKDINLRLKARSLNIKAEDYETGKVKDIHQLYKGHTTLEVSQNIISKIYTSGYCLPKDVKLKTPIANHYYILKNGQNSALVYFNNNSQQLERINRENAYGIKPRNVEQSFALHAVMNPNVQLVTIQGIAGTGKTLIALSGAMAQKQNFHQIYIARPIVPLSNKDIGFLPGDIKAKINPYMEPLWDNLKLIQSQYKETDREYQKIKDMVDKEKIYIAPLAYIRGRSLSNIIFIVDEAQNLTPHEVKTIITRAGENTKIIFTGDIFQIDTPYLDTHSNGLSYLIDRMKNHPLYAHITLEKGERSELANVASLML
ncbi:MAG: PhoH family protein [Bacteroidia bacterium]|nr:PhoH family protein [Bacteroidia bacterium]MCZ2249420.1 PhoH family protein [Bacteroidia bacterium]